MNCAWTEASRPGKRPLAAVDAAGATFACRYLSFERFPNDHFVHLCDRQATQIWQRLSHEDVPLVILDNETASSTMQTYPRIAAYMTQRYHEVGRVGAAQGTVYIVLPEHRRLPVRLFGKGKLPCFASPDQPQLSRFQ